MGIRGVQNVRDQMRAVFAQISGPMTERTLTEVLIIGGGHADAMTPIDLGNLVNSRFREVRQVGNKWIARYGYTAAYAAAVHEMTGKLRGQPRSSVAAFTTRSGAVAFAGDQGNFWDPSAEPQWLEKGFERDGLDEIRAAIRRNMQL